MGLGARANGTLPPVAVIPLKGLDHAKSRLNEVLSRDDRADLALRLLAGVVAACQEAGLLVCVVSPDPLARAEAVRLGAEALDDGGLDLSRITSSAVIAVFIIGCIALTSQAAGGHPGTRGKI